MHLSGGDTLSDGETLPATRAPGLRPWERHAVPASAADRGTFWAPEAVEEVQYPTRMARRRALEAAQILDGWQPDPVLTPPLLERVGDELLRLFDTVTPTAVPEADKDVALEEPEPDVVRSRTGSRRRAHTDPSVRRGWRRRGRSAADCPVEEAPPARTTSRVVRQDDPVDDAAWFAGLKAMTRAEEAESDAVDVVDTPSTEAAARPRADVQQIVPATAPRRRRPVRRWVAAAVAVAVLGAAGALVVLNRGGAGSRDAAVTAVTPQQAVVVAFSLSQAAASLQSPASKGTKTRSAAVQAGDVTGLTLLAAGGGSAQQVLVPSRLLLDVPGAGRVSLSRSLLGSADAPGEAIGDALEVAVATTWTLDSTALAALVDRVGGVVVDVDTDITQGTQVGAAVLLGAGPGQKLTGDQAALFAQFLGAEEPEAARLARQEQVLRGVLTALPDDPATIRTIVSGLPGAPDGASLDAVVRVVSASRLAAASDELASTMLPVKEIDAGGSTTAYGLDDKAAAQLVDARLAGAKLPVAAVGHVRVLVQNGVGTPGLGDSARTKLLAAGLRYVAGGNLPGFGQDETVVLLRDASSTNRERGMAVARALGLGQSSLRISESAPTIADIVVILGSDYRAG